MHTNDDGYGHTAPELRQSVLERAVRDIELQRDSRNVGVPKKRGRKPNRGADLNAAFARAAREDAELRRLKALHPHFSGLYFGLSGDYGVGGESGNGSSPR
jgi:hypothetical protein